MVRTALHLILIRIQRSFNANHVRVALGYSCLLSIRKSGNRERGGTNIARAQAKHNIEISTEVLTLGKRYR